MKIVAYLDPEGSAPIAEQRIAIQAWIEAMDWTLCDEITGSASALEAAVAASKAHGATLLVSNTVMLPDVLEVPIASIPAVSTVVVYYREHSRYPEALTDQKRRVAAWLRATGGVVLKSLTDREGDSKAGSAAQLGKAISLCKRSNALLLIARSTAIDANSRFDLPRGIVRYEIIPGPPPAGITPPADLPKRIPVPEGAPSPYCLYFADRGFQYSEWVYFCNNTKNNLIVMNLDSLHSISVDDDVVTIRNTFSVDVNILPAMTGMFFTKFDHIYENDFIVGVGFSVKDTVTGDEFDLSGRYGKGSAGGHWKELTAAPKMSAGQGL